MTNQNKKKRRVHYGRLLDIGLSLASILCSIFLVWKVKTLDIFPGKYILALVAILVILNVVIMILILVKMKPIALTIKRALIILLCAGIGVTGVSLGKARDALNNVTAPQNTTIKMSIITKNTFQNGAVINSIADLKTGMVGIQAGPDKENGSYMASQINNELSNQISFQEYDDYTGMANALLLEQIDAMAISDSYLSMLDLNMEGFKGTYKVIQTYSRELPPEENVSTKDITKEPFTVYISGMDELGSPDQNLRSDVNILLMVNPLTNHIQMVSFPRDGYIPNTGASLQNDKLTHTGIYGIDTTVASMENFLNIDIDYYAKVSFSSLIEIVDIIGGIDVDVEIEFCEQDEKRSFAYDDQICLNAGQQTLNGKQALAYSRHRHTDNYDNPGRERAQQRVIKGIINKLVSPSGVTKINALMDAVPNYVVTNMPAGQITSFVNAELDDLKPWTIASTVIGDSGVFDTRVTASLGADVPQDVYLFNMDEVAKVLYAYENFMKPLQTTDFKFNLDALYESDIPFNASKSFPWDMYALNPH